MLDAPEQAGDPHELASRLYGDAEQTILELVGTAYDAWRNDNFTRHGNHETDFTVRIVYYILEIARRDDLPYRPQTECVQLTPAILEGHADASCAKRIDISVGWGKVSDEESYTIECKRLAPGVLASLYVREGIQRFIDGSYASDNVFSGMLGYVVHGDPVILAEVVNAQLPKNDPPLDATHRLVATNRVSGRPTCCESRHVRVGGIAPIRLTHLFLDMRDAPPVG